MNSSNLAVLEFNGEVASSSASPPLRQSVKKALENYLFHLEDQSPVNLYELVLEEIEAPLLEVVMKLTKNNQSKAAKLLGLSRGTLRKKLKQYNLDC
ncbi:MAG: DNA-binding transcriptional regulator Fis [Gammaproteobacteria bacterium]|nr:DNA-binding transcriptional regulator Fis [Gammaproteobacteria bacterium]